MFYVFWQLAGVGRKRAKLLGQDIYRTYMLCGVLTLFVWLCYPIAWGVSEVSCPFVCNSPHSSKDHVLSSVLFMRPINNCQANGFGQGANVIAPDSEAVFYGVLDFFAKPVFSVALIIGHWNISPARMGLIINYGDEIVPQSREKAGHNGVSTPSDGVTNEHAATA